MRQLGRLAVIALVLVVAYPAWLAFQVWERSHEDEVRRADAIVVLGAAQYDGEPSPVLRARLDQALYLYGEELAERIIVTGGKRAGDRYTESQAARSYLEEGGVPSDRIIEEPQGRTTWESLQHVRQIAEEHGISSALFVSDPLHSERIDRMATDLGFEGVYTSYASYDRLPRSRETKVKELAREVGSLLIYEFLDR